MENMDFKEVEEKLVNSKITYMRRMLDLVMIDFLRSDDERHIALHIQSFFRIYRGDKLLICSEDMSRKGRNAKKRFHWTDVGTTLYDDEVEDNSDLITSVTVKSAELKNNNDLIINFSDGVRLEVLTDTLESEEKFRIFDSERDYFVSWT